jgi:hypothetical protein
VTVAGCREPGIWFDRAALQRVVPAAAPPQAQQSGQPMQQPPPPPSMGGMQPGYAQQPSYPQQPPPPPAQQLSPGMAPGQYVAPGWLDGNQPQAPFGLGGAQTPGAAPGMPGQPAAGGAWGLGKTALAVGGGLAAVAGVAYVASHTNIGQQAMGTHQSGFGAVGEVLSKLF